MILHEHLAPDKGAIRTADGLSETAATPLVTQLQQVAGERGIDAPLATASITRDHSAATAPLDIEAIRGSVACIDGIADEWRVLCEEGSYNEPFYRPEWIIAFIQAFEPSATLLVLTARRAGRLRAVLPLVEERIGGFPRGAHRLRAPVNPHSNRFDLVHGVADGDEAMRAIWQFLAAMPGWQHLATCYVPTGGALHRMLKLAAEDGFLTHMQDALLSPYIPLPGPDGDFQAVLSRTHGHFRANVRRRMRKLEAKGPVALVRFDHEDQGALERFYAMESAGWKGQQATAIAYDPKTRAFYDNLAAGAARFGYLSLYELRCGSQLVASHFGLMLGDRYFVPKLTHNEAFRDCGPGQLIVHEVLRDCINRELRVFEFLGMAMDWKAEWTNDVRHHLQCSVYRKGPIGNTLYLKQTLRRRFAPVGRRVRATLRKKGARR